MENEEEKSHVDVISMIAKDDGYSVENALNMFLAHCIRAFDISKLYKANGHDSWAYSVLMEDERYAPVIEEWMRRVADSMGKKRYHDFFGQTYEAMFQSKGKSSVLGQYFTPDGVARAMAGISKGTDEKKRINTVYDCCCGSGRLLLANIFSPPLNVPKIFIGEDIDIVSCRMCALNLMAHGCYGMVVCHDVLTDSVPHVIYIVNECRFPFTAVHEMCIRTLDGKDAERFWKLYKTVGISLLVP